MAVLSEPDFSGLDVAMMRWAYKMKPSLLDLKCYTEIQDLSARVWHYKSRGAVETPSSKTFRFP